MMVRCLVTGILAAGFWGWLPERAAAQTADQRPAQQIAIWQGRAPLGDGRFADEDASISIYLPEKPDGTAVVICPGGGYSQVVTEPEGHGIARWLSRHGIAGVVLEYRLPHGRSLVPLLDAQRAIRTVRANARDWKLDPGRIGIMGFSAGGHLASTAETHFVEGNRDDPDPVSRVSSRPDFMILIYPVISLGEHAHQGSRSNLLGDNPTPEVTQWFSSETQVTPRTPPAFLAHAVDDRPVPPIHSRLFRDAMIHAGVPVKLLELPSGGHGLDGYQGPMWQLWQEQSLAWLADLRLRPAAENTRR